MIRAHGGSLNPRTVDADRATQLQRLVGDLPKIMLPAREQCDVEMLGSGAFSPLDGFMGEKDFHSVCENMHLANGTAWPIPITCSVDAQTAENIPTGSQVALCDDNGPIAVLTVDEKYAHDKTKEAESVYKTTSDQHPGVAVVMKQGDICMGGPVEVLPNDSTPQFEQYWLNPSETRAAFEERSWKSVVAFQTRNPIHRAHEYLTKCALEICDGLLIHPLVGETQAGDIPADVRMQCYEVLIENYYCKDNTMLAVMPAAMRYAGPREAILHALVRQNYGCTHFIVGRDHAGVGDYYGTYDAQNIFDEFEPGEILITPLKFEHASYCTLTGGMASNKTSPSKPDQRIFLSGTKVREMLSRGERPPAEFTRPEVADLLIASVQKQ